MSARTTLSIIAAAVGLALNASRSSAGDVDFSHDIQPILSTNCFECHGPDGGSREAELRLDVREGALGEGSELPIITPGDPERSAIIARITSADPDIRMPPADRAPLSSAQVQLVRQWIAQGAPYEEHWAFRPVKRSTLPAVQVNAWTTSPVDQFVLDRLEQENLNPAKRASRETLIRRATLDLTGLPPTPDEVEAFLDDDSPDAFAKLVDRLLDSPHYGERWARHWLDVARYADSGGFETDIFFGHAWRYRDYVIRSLNADKPFDEFIKEQIAGDELYPDRMDARVATGFYTIGPVLQEAGMVEGKLDNDLLTDAVDATASAFLGLTIGCARCHDHKYDPVSQRDYYALQAIFAASEQIDLDESGKVLRTGVALRKTIDQYKLEQVKVAARAAKNPRQRDEHLRKIGDYYIEQDEELQERIEQSEAYAEYDKARRRYREISEQQDQSDRAAELLRDIGEHAQTLAGEDRQSRRALRRMSREARNGYLTDFGREHLDLPPPVELIEDVGAFRLAIGQENLDGPSTIPVRTLAHRDSPLTIRLLARGELAMPGEEVLPAIPEHLDPGRSRLSAVPPSQRRAALANWIASPENPLTARVMVNRVWQGHFGEGLVRTPNDFGIRGERPTHPQLLDWLTAEFVANGWSLKRLHRTIMLSSTYQMASIAEADALARDPGNRLLTRYQPHRLEAEPIWDSIRAVAGSLNRQMYGLPVAPPLDEQETIGNYKDWPTSSPEEVNRRGVYLLTRRSFRFPMLSSFDLPENAASCGRRDITTVPNQCLALLNNRTLHEQAAAFAERLMSESDGDLDAIPALAWQYAYARRIAAEEQQHVANFLTDRIAELSLESIDKQGATCSTLTELCLAIFNTNEFIFIQ